MRVSRSLASKVKNHFRHVVEPVPVRYSDVVNGDSYELWLYQWHKQMGKFDKIYTLVKCPYCDEEHVMECQTKDMENKLNDYEPGDWVGHQYQHLICICECESEKCNDPRFKGPEHARPFFFIRIGVVNGMIDTSYIYTNERGDAVTFQQSVE